jgi:aspartyl-tRNA(Asn)/glutamyl-tRNA(Gln) amidotransferase subunit A
VVGLKPTFGRVSLRGVIPLSWNLDHVGPLTRTVTDAALLLRILAGPDEADPASVDAPMAISGDHLEDGVRGWRILHAGGDYVEDCDPEVRDAIDGAAMILERIGAIVERQDLSDLGPAARANSLMTQADAATFHRERLAEQPQLFGDDVRIRLETGRDVTVTEYVLARRTQTEMRHRLEGLLARYDVILLPSTPITAPAIEGGDAVLQARKLTRFTAPFNLTGLPAISVPGGFSREGMPIGIQLVSGAWKEARLLQAARAYERETEWGLRRPPIS